MSIAEIPETDVITEPTEPAPARPVIVPVVEPKRALCVHCLVPVLTVEINGRQVTATIHEWEPRHACDHCAHTRRRMQNLGMLNGRCVHCAVCGDSGYVGARRPSGWMLAIDMAWEGEHIRVIGPRTDRRAGEALYSLHVCGEENYR